MRIDLHLHSHYSDGSLSPSQVVRAVKEFEVTVMALTDHDTLAGIPEALTAAAEENMVMVPGVELSIDYPLKGKAHLHLLGLFLDHTNQAINLELERLRTARLLRGEKIVRKLQQLGMNLTNDDLQRVAGDGSIGRPHLARLLMEKGYVSSVKEAFFKYLSKDRPAYVPKEKLKIKPAIDLIHRAGGVAILAHPISLGYPTYDRFGMEILKLKEMGLDGIEAYYSSHDRYFTQWLLEFARKNGLIASGGSDFHGDAKPDIKPGIGFNNLNVPYEIYENLKEYHRLVAAG